MPDQAKPFPICKLSSSLVPATEIVWRLFDGHEFRFARYLPRCLINAPLIQLTSDDILQERILTGWTPAKDVLEENLAKGDGAFVWDEFPLETEYNKVYREYDSIFDFLDKKQRRERNGQA